MTLVPVARRAWALLRVPLYLPLFLPLFLPAWLGFAAMLGPSGAWACDCFSSEMRLKTAKDTLALAHLAAFGQIATLNADGSAVFSVLEAYKGTEKGGAIVVAAGPDRCAERRPKSGQQLLLLAFDGPPDACGVYPADNFLVKEFRALSTR